MVKKPLKIQWDKKAIDELKNILEHISKESPVGAKIVKAGILDTVKALKKTPLVFSADTLKDNNDNTYRAFTVYSYRVSYKVEKEVVKILRVRHTSREPLVH